MLQPKNPALLRGYGKPSQIPSIASGLGNFWSPAGPPAPPIYQFPARLISQPVSCEYSPVVFKMFSTLSSLA